MKFSLLTFAVVGIWMVGWLVDAVAKSNTIHTVKWPILFFYTPIYYSTADNAQRSLVIKAKAAYTRK